MITTHISNQAQTHEVSGGIHGLQHNPRLRIPALEVLISMLVKLYPYHLTKKSWRFVCTAKLIYVRRYFYLKERLNSDVILEQQNIS